ncbi:hypothetical protein AGRA3207_003644 [Actinomadura graeca]|uniref:Uncharacterized protein n=2 Tax=Actinomadura graeca TaxID=2750812 RepID=A0ABX8R685_9ACTN|nr:hypothetical protein AGRA3207_003644 [Actinomadura graeca]
MTTPEENAAKTEDTDQVVMKPGGDSGQDADQAQPDPDVRPELGAELEDKMAEKGISRDDFGES